MRKRIKKTVVLFGAGAENVYGFSNGKAFAKAVLGINANSKSGMNKAIKEFYCDIEKNNDWYPNFRIKNWDINDLYKAAFKKKCCFVKPERSKYRDIDTYILENIKKMSKSEKERLLDDYLSYVGIMDELFYTIINPRIMGTNRFWALVSCYWRAYLSLVHKILPKRSYSWIMNNPQMAYSELCKYAQSYSEIDSYYKVLSKFKKDINISVVTTNYTPFCEIITGFDETRISYVNGSFKWFEQPHNLKVLDIENEVIDTNDFFPFIFIQSGTKPVVDSIQINELAKANSFFSDCNRLIICGYGAGLDDNHINSLIRKCIVNDCEVFYMDYSATTSEDVLKRFRINEDYKSFFHIPINKENSIQVFENLLN